MAELEEKLREAACFGDIDGVKELLAHGVNVNAQHEINGWTALHWAAKRNHLNIVNLLCNHGADKNIPTNKGEVAAQLTSEGVIKVLLNAMKGGSSSSGGGDTKPAVSNGSPAQPAKATIKEEKLAITPNYIRNPPLAYQVSHQSDDPGIAEAAALGSFEHLALDDDEPQGQGQHPPRDHESKESLPDKDNFSASSNDNTTSEINQISEISYFQQITVTKSANLSDKNAGNFASHALQTAASYSVYENCIAVNMFKGKPTSTNEHLASNSAVKPPQIANERGDSTAIWRDSAVINPSVAYYNTSSSDYSDLPSDSNSNSADFSNEYLLETSSDSAEYFMPLPVFKPSQTMLKKCLELSNRNLSFRRKCCNYLGETLSDQMIAFTEGKQLDTNNRLKIGELLAFVESSVNNIFPGISVECFGSCVNGLGTRTSDIDVHVDLDNQINPDGSVINRNRKFELLQSLFQQQTADCLHVEPVPNARVPVIKFQHTGTGLHCDLSFKNRMGVLNSNFILAVTNSEPRFQPLFTTLKYLLKQQGLMGGSWDRLTSYALTLMLIFYLQAMDTPLLPPMAKILNLKDPDVSHNINGWIFSFDVEKLEAMTSENRMDLESLLTGFFKFYSTFYYEFIICPFFGTELTRDTLINKKFGGIDTKLELTYPKPAKHFKWCFDETGVFKRGLQVNCPLVVQDPFELNHNVTKNVDGLTVRYFKMFCSEALNVYSSIPSLISPVAQAQESSIYGTPKRQSKRRTRNSGGRNKSQSAGGRCLCQMFRISIYDKYYDEYLDRQQIPGNLGAWPPLKVTDEPPTGVLPRLTTSSNQLICYLCPTDAPGTSSGLPTIRFQSFHDLRSHLLDQHAMQARKYFFRPVQILETEKLETGKYKNSFGLLQNICCMNEFRGQSQEEIRLSEYSRKQL